MQQGFRSTLLFLCFTVLIFSCTKDKDVFVQKEGQENVEMLAKAPSVKSILVPVRGSQMVPAINTKTLGSVWFDLRTNKTVSYKATLFKLRPGEFATSAILYQGEPGETGVPVYSVPFLPGDNGVKKYLKLTDDQYDALVFLLSPPILPLLPNSYFVVTTNLNPTGLLRGAVQL